MLAVTKDPHPAEFVRRDGPDLKLGKITFRFAGSNNYYLIYGSTFMVNDVLATAHEQGFRVMRAWGALDINTPDGGDSIDPGGYGVYFQYWDGDAPAYNDGGNGLQRLDYVLYRARLEGIRIVLPFVNNWSAFGGMDQYVQWRGGSYHDQFYTDPTIRGWFKDWIQQLLDRVNVYDDISAFVKSVDSNHLVSVGDEGFYCLEGAEDFTEDCSQGVDTLALAALDNIDVMSFHLYPDHWGMDIPWSTEWVSRHFAEARNLGKPAMLGEYGLLDQANRNLVFKEWTDAVFESGGSGALYWILSGHLDGGTLYPDYDGFTVYCPSPVCTTVSHFAAEMKYGREWYFQPVADHDVAFTEVETPVVLQPLGNDFAYGRAELVPRTLDLDLSRFWGQSSVTVAGGTYTADESGLVTFTPEAGFEGDASTNYVVRDQWGTPSNTATMTVIVTQPALD